MRFDKINKEILTGQKEQLVEEPGEKLELFDDDSGVDLSDFNGKFMTILGMTGSGKTNSAAVFLEELIAKRIPFLMVDIENEYSSLQNYPDGGKHIRIYNQNKINKENCVQIAFDSLINYKPIIIECQGIEIKNLYEILTLMFRALLKTQEHRKEQGIAEPYYIVIEEAHLIIPQNASISQKGIDREKLKEITVQIARRGRKYGLYAVFISQRIQDIDKGVVSQAGIQLLHRVKIIHDLEVYKYILREVLSGSEIEIAIPKLNNGEVYYVNTGQIENHMMRLRTTVHIGSTPMFRKERKFN